jgi:hypothetical protein
MYWRIIFSAIIEAGGWWRSCTTGIFVKVYSERCWLEVHGFTDSRYKFGKDPILWNGKELVTYLQYISLSSQKILCMFTVGRITAV